MDNKKIIIIIGILLLIVVGAFLVMLTSPNYERLEITPNGTSIDVPIDKTDFGGDFEGVKIWYWDNGVLIAHNNHEGEGVIKLIGLSFNTINELIKAGKMENMDGFTCYVINASDLVDINLYDIIDVKYSGEFYCIPLSNGNSQDNIIICCNDKDTALHMARSVQYKNVYPDDIDLDDVISTVKNITEG